MEIRRRLTMKVLLTGTAVVRNRMPGGVGGRREQSRLLPDPVVYVVLRCVSVKGITKCLDIFVIPIGYDLAGFIGVVISIVATISGIEVG